MINEKICVNNEDICFQLVRRLAPVSIEDIDLTKPRDVHLGFSIAGGITHEHVKGFVSLIISLIIHFLLQ